jgi:hypothetical protein
VKAILFYVEESVYRNDWRAFTKGALELGVSGARRLAPNVWLINLPEGIELQQKLTALAKTRGLASHSLEVAHEGKWLQG